MGALGIPHTRSASKTLGQFSNKISDAKKLSYLFSNNYQKKLWSSKTILKE